MSRKHVEDAIEYQLDLAKGHINSGNSVMVVSALSRALGLAQALFLFGQRDRGKE